MFDHEILPQGLSAWIAVLAKRHGVAYERTPSSALAEVVTRLPTTM